MLAFLFSPKQKPTVPRSLNCSAYKFYSLIIILMSGPSNIKEEVCSYLGKHTLHFCMLQLFLLWLFEPPRHQVYHRQNMWGRRGALLLEPGCHWHTRQPGPALWCHVSYTLAQPAKHGREQQWWQQRRRTQTSIRQISRYLLLYPDKNHNRKHRGRYLQEKSRSRETISFSQREKKNPPPPFFLKINSNSNFSYP